MRFSLTIESNNSAMVGDEGYAPTGDAVAELLDQAARDLRDGATSGRLRDANGHQVGTWGLTTD